MGWKTRFTNNNAQTHTPARTQASKQNDMLLYLYTFISSGAATQRGSWPLHTWGF